MQKQDRILRAGMFVVDLGCAPGGFSQAAAAAVKAARGGQSQTHAADSKTAQSKPKGGRVVGVDVLPMAAIDGVHFIRGDFADPATRAKIDAALLLNGRAPHIDALLSDMSPNLSGDAARDQAAMAVLAFAVLDFARGRLAARGRLLMKVFAGEEFDAVRAAAARQFASVAVRKPAASRAESREVYLLASGAQAE